MSAPTASSAATGTRATSPAGRLPRLRATEFPLLGSRGIAYLDYTGAALPPLRLVDGHHARLRGSVLGNPHSAHGPSRASTRIVDRARKRVLSELGADPAEYVVVFTHNASSALRLVGEAFPFGPARPFVMAADNHNSVVGIRRFAAARGGEVVVLPLDRELRLDPRPRLDVVGGRGLLAFPAQSNFSGVRHPLELVERARTAGHRVLLDAAAFLPTRRLDLGALPADFVALSAYKIFGYPTGVGALVARRDAVAELERPWFAGGTVEFVSVRHGVHRGLDGPEVFEDGTPDFQGLGALEAGWDFMAEVGWTVLGEHVAALTARLLDGLTGLRHADGRAAVLLHGPSSTADRGGSVAFNGVAADGRILPFARIEEEASRRGIAVRGGCFCNPGASEAAFDPPEPALVRCLEALATGPFSPERLAGCLGHAPVGAVRASPGLATNEEDVDRLVEVVADVTGAA